MRRHLTVAASALALLWALVPSFVRGDDRAPSPEDLRALIARVISNQHRDDAALEQYERIEHRRSRKSASDAAPADDKTFRVVPTGTGTVRVQLEEHGQPVDAELYRRQLRDVEQALVWAFNPAEPKQKQRVEKGVKRSRDRAEIVEAVRDAFRVTWLGRETRSGPPLDRLQLDPNPAYRASSRNTSLFPAIRAIVWVDPAAAQLARVEAELIRDFSFGGGLIGKAYRGSRFVMEQTEVAPGIWLPTRYEYNFTGRKFLFSYELHETIEVSHYRRIGPPQEAVLAIRRELGSVASAGSSR